MIRSFSILRIYFQDLSYNLAIFSDQVQSAANYGLVSHEFDLIF